MADNSFLTQLIQESADAQNNLYKATFSFSVVVVRGITDKKVKEILDGNGTSLSVRLTKFNSPARSVQTVSLPFQNINMNIPVVSSNLENKISLSFRVDDNYNLYKLLRECLPLKSTGEWNSKGETSDFKKLQWSSIRVDAFKGGNSEYLTQNKGVVSWKFLNCRLLSLPSLSYSYNSPSTLEISCDFTYERCDER